MDVGFLFNHDAPHQVAHALPIAIRLSMMRPDIRVHVFYTEPAAPEVGRMLSTHRHRCFSHQLGISSRAGRIASAALGRSAPLARLAVLSDNRHIFADLDALVVPEKTSLFLKTRLGLHDLRMIHTRHGAGDRAIGFDKSSGLFDFVLVSGNKVRDRLRGAGLLKPDGYAVVGYPKFDLIDEKRPPAPFFDNDRPTVLYNPHPSPHLSSWYKMGRQILDFFARSERYNLIFAPHIMLFKRRMTVTIDRLSFGVPGTIAADYLEAPNIHVDLGSPASIDMTYTQAADIYLGDASSQVYEFLARPRPCLFANPHRLDWRGNPDFAHWRAGPVFDHIDELEETLAASIERHSDHAQAQRAIFAYTFDLGERPSSERAAGAIARYLDRSATVTLPVGEAGGRSEAVPLAAAR